MTTTVEAAAPSATEDVAAQVRAELARRRMSGRELARRTPKDAQYWWRRLAGEVPLNVEDLVLIADVLEVPVSVLVAPLDAAVRGGDANDRYGPAAGQDVEFWDIVAELEA